MGDCPTKADGRQIFTAEFKRGVVQQIKELERSLGRKQMEIEILQAASERSEG